MTSAEEFKPHLEAFNKAYDRIRSWGRISDEETQARTVFNKDSLDLLQRITAGGADPMVNPTQGPLREFLQYRLWDADATAQANGLHMMVREAARDIIYTKPEERVSMVGVLVHSVVHFLEEYVEEVDRLLKAAAPASQQFTYQGFRVTNPDGLSAKWVRFYLDALDYLVVLFRKRGVEEALKEGLTEVTLLWKDLFGGEHAAGRYYPTEKRITMHTRMGMGGRLLKDWVSEIFIHEFGHHLHMNFMHPRARAEWDAAWAEVDKAKADFESKVSVTYKDRQRFFDLIRANGWDPGRAGSKLKGLDRLKFLAWLYKTQGEPVTSTPKQVRLTPYGKHMFQFFADPEGMARSSIGNPDDPEAVQRYVERLMRAKLSTLGLTEHYAGSAYPTLDKEIVEEIRSADPSVDNALNTLGIPSEYGRTNEKEDFAETFVVFMDDPNRLSDTARYRMQRALSLSGLYGKQVMRMAARVADRWPNDVG